MSNRILPSSQLHELSNVNTEQAEKRAHSFQLVSLANMKHTSLVLVFHATRPLIRVMTKINKNQHLFANFGPICHEIETKTLYLITYTATRNLDTFIYFSHCIKYTGMYYRVVLECINM